MKELGELQANHGEFQNRGVQVVVLSMENREKASASQADFPDLKIVVDPDGSACRTLGMVHQGAAPDKNDAAAPTTVLVDGQGIVRWMFRPDFHIVRLSPKELLEAVDKHLPRTGPRLAHRT